MREIGIIKYFDRLEGCGVIAQCDEPTNFTVKEDDLKCKANDLQEGTFVTFRA